MVIENQYIQTSLMVALSLFRGKERGGPIYGSEVDITKIQTLFGRFKLPIVVDVCFVQSMFSTELWNVCYNVFFHQSPFNVVKL